MVKPVYALVGDDSFLQLQRLAAIVKQLPADAQRVDVDGERAELADVLDELRSFAMFGGAKLVVVRDADAFLSRFREALEDYVANPSGSGTLVLRLNALPKQQRVYKAIAKSGRVEDCTPPADVTKWVVEHARAAHGIAVGVDAARLLGELIGNDLGRLDGELAKLALQTDDGTVGPEHVSAGVAFQREQEMYDMTNELAAGNAVEALQRWRQLVQLDASAEFRAVTWLSMWLEDVGTVVRGGQTGKLSWKYKNRLPQFIRSANVLGRAGHARALDLLAEVDHQSKSGVGDAARNVERFILRLAGEAAACAG